MNAPASLRTPKAGSAEFRRQMIALVKKAQLALEIEVPSQAAHRARVALKRARALARLSRHAQAAPEAWAVAFNTQARAAMAGLGAARDADAVAQAARLCAAGAGPRARRALLRAAEAFESEGAELATAQLEDARRDIDQLMAIAQQAPTGKTADLAAGAAGLTLRAAKAAAKAHGARGSEARHTWRKREKARLLAAQELGAAWPLKARLGPGAAIGQLLGAERDLILLEERLRAEPAAAGGAEAALRALRVVRRMRAVFAALADRQGQRLYRSGG